MKPSPSVRGTKIQWYIAVNANWSLDKSTIEAKIIVYDVLSLGLGYSV
jgi:hypothetical protein